MKLRLAIAGLALVLSQSLLAAEKNYQPVTIVDVQQKTNSRVLYYVVNTPITKDEPYYEVSVQLKDRLYVAQYTPRHSADTLPEEWKSGASAQARVDGRHLAIKRPEGGEIEFVIIKRKVVKAQNNPESARTQ
jgi:hypothetical protein